jgi:hypothetical protein
MVVTAPRAAAVLGESSMRVLSFLVAGAVTASLPGALQAQDAFMKECLVTGSQKMCECMSGKVPADKRAAAVDGMRKSNAATQPGGNLLDPSTLTSEQMQGLDAVVIAQASCM